MTGDEQIIHMIGDVLCEKVSSDGNFEYSGFCSFIVYNDIFV